MSAALVDVLLATYNGAKYLEAQLDSILAQTHQAFRILVSDDGSSDATPQILQRYQERLGERLVLVPNPSAGSGVVRNFGNLMQASLDDGVAQWAVFADQDDVWLPEKIASLWSEMVRIEGGGGAVAQPCRSIRTSRWWTKDCACSRLPLLGTSGWTPQTAPMCRC